MEVTCGQNSEPVYSRPVRSSFDCEFTTIDSILGLRSIGNQRLRIDVPRTTRAAETNAIDSNVCARGITEIDVAIRHERLIRLLHQQQAWYDAAQQAAESADYLLKLCEHHQQPWIQSPGPT
jgi:hypothetical protein